MPVSGVNGSNNNARVQADDARAEAARRRVEVENQRAAQKQPEPRRGTGMDVAV